MALVNQNNSDPGLGYVIVCNRSQRHLDISLSERHENERVFLSQAPWNMISKERAGVASLKRRLNNLAIEAGRRSFEDVGQEIVKKLNDARTRLKTLGSPRHTAEAQRLFLLQLASEYQTLINKATDAHYGRDECFRRHSSLRLATMVMKENEKFSAIIAKKGCRRLFSRHHKSDTDSESEPEPDVAPDSRTPNGVPMGLEVAEPVENGSSVRNFSELRCFSQVD